MKSILVWIAKEVLTHYRAIFCISIVLFLLYFCGVFEVLERVIYVPVPTSPEDPKDLHQSIATVAAAGDVPTRSFSPPAADPPVFRPSLAIQESSLKSSPGLLNRGFLPRALPAHTAFQPGSSRSVRRQPHHAEPRLNAGTGNFVDNGRPMYSSLSRASCRSKGTHSMATRSTTPPCTALAQQSRSVSHAVPSTRSSASDIHLPARRHSPDLADPPQVQANDSNHRAGMDKLSLEVHEDAETAVIQGNSAEKGAQRREVHNTVRAGATSTHEELAHGKIESMTPAISAYIAQGDRGLKRKKGDVWESREMAKYCKERPLKRRRIAIDRPAPYDFAGVPQMGLYRLYMGLPLIPESANVEESGRKRKREDAGEPCESEDGSEEKMQKRRRIAVDRPSPYDFGGVPQMVLYRLYMGEPLILSDGTVIDTTHHGRKDVAKHAKRKTGRAAGSGNTRDGNSGALLAGQSSDSRGGRSVNSAGENESGLSSGQETTHGSRSEDGANEKSEGERTGGNEASGRKTNGAGRPKKVRFADS